MSGFEVVGVVLGAIPLVIEAFNRIRPRIDAYRHYKKKVDLLLVTFISQCTIFRNTARNLHSGLVSHRLLLEAWLKRQGPEQLELQSDLEHCNKLIQLIQDSLTSIGEKLLSMGDQVMQSGSTSLVGNLQHGGSEHIRRLKFAIKKKDVDISKDIDELQKLMSYFGVIAPDILKAIEQVLAWTAPTKKNKGFRADDLTTIRRYKSVRSASRKLFQTMAQNWRCPGHENHVVSVSYAGDTGQMTTRAIHYSLALWDVPRNNQSSTSPNAVWLEVEHHDMNYGYANIPAVAHVSQPTQSTTQSQVLVDMVKTLDVSSSLHPSVNPGIQPPSSLTRGIASQGPQSNQVPAHSPAIGSQTIDLIFIPDFCLHFRELTSAHAANKQEAILRPSPASTYVQKFISPLHEQPFDGPPLTLADIITSTRNLDAQSLLGPIALPLPITLQVAGSMAMFILHFHSTPWLKQEEQWQSHEIKLFRHRDTAKTQLSTPRLEVQLNKEPAQINQRRPLPSPGVTASSTAVSRSRSTIPFTFGVTLLELALCQTWDSLKSEAIATFNLPPPRQNDHHIALEWWRRLKERRRVGPDYLRAVHECICWEFSGWDMEAGGPSEESQREDREIVLLRGVERKMEELSRGLDRLLAGGFGL